MIDVQTSSQGEHYIKEPHLLPIDLYISNILIKGIYHANNVKISPLKKKCSLDFEAFDTDLDEYIKRFPLFFTQKPEKI